VQTEYDDGCGKPIGSAKPCRVAFDLPSYSKCTTVRNVNLSGRKVRKAVPKNFAIETDLKTCRDVSMVQIAWVTFQV
jgi:hypothetical protein